MNGILQQPSERRHHTHFRASLHLLILHSLSADWVLCQAVLGSKKQRPKAQKTGTEGGLGRERVLGAGLGSKGLVEPNLYYIVH